MSKNLPERKKRKTVKAWAVISPDDGKFVEVAKTREDAEYYKYSYQRCVPCTITYKL